ncbi:MAG TPA: LacI family DNA-binding transcriptional regulator, partial [Chthonomonadales bacterium]|nr:LacI family DNA-binding transcriptional regulator [Chthonomonadales bacterium]
MRITIKQIASELGVSHSTVSRVLNKKQSAMVSDSTRDRILATAVQMGYRPSRLAQALKNETTCLVGIFIPDTYNYFYNDVHAHLREAVEASGYELATFYSSPEDLVHTWERLVGWDLDGIFVFDHMLYVDRLREAV